jgi:hypothetical protein
MSSGGWKLGLLVSESYAMSLSICLLRQTRSNAVWNGPRGPVRSSEILFDEEQAEWNEVNKQSVDPGEK